MNGFDFWFSVELHPLTAPPQHYGRIVQNQAGLIIFSNCVYILSFTMIQGMWARGTATSGRSHRKVHTGKINSLSEVFSNIFQCCKRTDFKDDIDLVANVRLVNHHKERRTAAFLSFTMGPFKISIQGVNCLLLCLNSEKRFILLCAVTLFTIFLEIRIVEYLRWRYHC